MEGNIKKVIKYWIEGEIETFIKVWLLIYVSLCYCYLASKILPKGSFRLLSFLPVICFSLYVPLKINSVHLCGNTGFFISWLCNFKLLLLAFDQGPLSDSSLSITKFLILACLPIKIQQKCPEKIEIYVQNGVNRGKFHQNGYFQETPSLNPAEKVSSVQSGKGFAKNGHFHETPFPNSVDKTENNVFQDGHFHEIPSPILAEKGSSVQSGKGFAKNGHFQEIPFPSSIDKTESNPFQDGHFHETLSQKSSEKGSSLQMGRDVAQNDHFQESLYLSYAKSNKGQKLNYDIKTLLFALIIRIYDYSDYIHSHIILVIYCFHIYLSLEIILAIISGLVRGLFGLQLEPQFNEPYLSTSLQDFWGQRWNLIVSQILRPTVYKPTLSLSTNILGGNWTPLPAVMVTFAVSGLMHELIFYYLGRVKPTWEITWFFLLHGVCLNIEICVKNVINDRFKLPRIIGTILTVGFVMITGFWLFFPQLLRCNSDVRAFAEYEAIGAFFKDITKAVKSTFLR
ncbi:acyl-CoA--sterol O-acyltransferase 1-like [Lycium barbarum]|uniref:acyl-CoA--sterol O-acyltransferase 1-like n=1 Tax=Lycium barbarum TaxID=112863 RepID=UPI00293E5C38|nr:acyl-CoA--sterol O-acyltransferase 1-like [Lycium barbarum]